MGADSVWLCRTGPGQVHIRRGSGSNCREVMVGTQLSDQCAWTAALSCSFSMAGVWARTFSLCAELHLRLIYCTVFYVACRLTNPMLLPVLARKTPHDCFIAQAV